MSQTQDTQADDPSRKPGPVARRWWRSLQTETRDGSTKPGDRAALARLRRASPLEAAMEEATLRLFRELGYRDSGRLARVATLAAVLAHIRADDEKTPLARAVGRPNIADREGAALKPLRFERLMQAQGEEEILRGFRRAVALLKGRANVADLARLVLDFDREETRRDFAFDYFAAGVAAPGPDAGSDKDAEAALS